PLVAMKPEDCPVRVTVSVIGGEWEPMVLFYLKELTMRFNEFRRVIPHAPHKALVQQLWDLGKAGIITRKRFPRGPPRVGYSRSGYGQTLRPVLTAMANWGLKYREQHPVKVWKQPPASSAKDNGRTAHL